MLGSNFNNTAKLMFNFSKESFISYSNQSPFPIQNIPFGVFQVGNSDPQIGVAIGSQILSLKKLAENEFFSKQIGEKLKRETLNDFFSLSKKQRNDVRLQVQKLLEKGSKLEQAKDIDDYFFPQEEVKMKLPVTIGDYTDFYASRNHAENIGEMFRGADNKLMPNWLHMPIAYHGRSSSLNVEKSFVRPQGQIDFSKCDLENKLDCELEMSFIIGGTTNQIGQPIPIQKATENIAGFCLMNDLSARAIQRIEYVPLGPFLGKNFSTVISPWVVFKEAIECFQEHRKPQEGVCDYLKQDKLTFYDIPLNIYLQPKGNQKKFLISQSNMKQLYWSFEQMIAHHSINGCPMKVGDLLASGTISGDDKFTQAGSLIELTWNGTKPLDLDGVKRTFLEDGDTIILSGGKNIPGTNQFLGFGDVVSTVIGR